MSRRRTQQSEELAALGQGESMPSVHVLVDLENNQPTLEDVKRLVPDVTHAWLFHSRSQVKRLASFAPLGAGQIPVPISRPGKNALDFHLSFYVGYIAARNPGARLAIVAIDRGYGPMIEHAVSLGFDVAQVPFKPRAAPVKKAVGKKAVVRKAPVGKAPAKKVLVVAKVPVAKAPKVPAAKTAKAKTPAKKVPSKKAPAKQPPAKKAAANKGAVATPAEAREEKAPKPAPLPAGNAATPAGKAALTTPEAKHQPKARPKPQPKPQSEPQRKPRPKVPAGRRAAGKPPAAEKVLANLRTMGEKRPKKIKQLRRYVSSMLGTGEADPAVGRLVDQLVAMGAVRVSGEALSYAPLRVGVGA